jgi:hypothetical protein
MPLSSSGLRVITVKEEELLMGDKPNYHGFLFSVAPSMDKILSEFKRQEARANVDSHWILQALKLFGKELKTFYKPIMKIKEVDVINLSTIPFIGGGIAGALTFFKALEWYWIIVVVVVLLAIVVGVYSTRMLNLYHPYFYLPAYKSLRKHEFDLLNHTVHDKHISYRGLAEYVNGLVTKQSDELEIVKAVTAQYNREKTALRQEIKQLRDKEEAVIQRYDDLVETLEEEIQWSETVIDYFVQLFHELYIILHRIGNGNCSFSDLKLIAGFTLYKQEGNKLTRIADEGTTGQNPQTIDLSRVHHNQWIQSIVKAAKNSPNLFKNEPKEGYHIVSYRMNIGNSSGETWIISLQIAPSVNKRGYHLTLTDDIIDQRVIFNMLHGLCQIIYNNRVMKKKEDGSYG